ncbi:adenosine deaminase [Microbacterium hatanonis]|uniref:Adenosine deaminase n=1 Tax=Microbacterium hatanonis TaxID=404366 RepID=A0A5C8HU03_9MICO|nr:adenosine deaminase [Microbacterium hatanonis]TXK09583.1 adenosine deaminase [Microbacterium hatanonis]
MNVPSPTRDLRALPKGHLHLHLEAAIRPETLADFAREVGVATPPTRGYDDFTGFVEMYGGVASVIGDETRLARLVDEAMADAADDGAVYVEFGVSPHAYVDLFGSIGTALDRHAELTAEAGARHGVAVGLMVTVDRTLGHDLAVEVARAAASRAGTGVVSLGLANEERGFPARDFAEPFAIAKAAGLQSTPHAGELVGPESVWEALDALHADRILHGVRSIEDPRLITVLAERGIPLDVCPTSNLLLHVVSDLAQHPLPSLLAAGVRCSINADDPVLFGPGILEDYDIARREVGLTDEQLAACAWTSIETTLAPDDVKKKAKDGIDAWIGSTEVAR